MRGSAYSSFYTNINTKTKAAIVNVKLFITAGQMIHVAGQVNLQVG